VAFVESWAAAMLNGQRVRLEPLRVEHADELMPVLDDSMLHTYVASRPT